MDSLRSSQAALSPSFHPHSWLSDSRSVHGGRSQYSRCCYLIIDLGFRLSMEAGPGTWRSHLISAVELGCSNPLYATALTTLWLFRSGSYTSPLTHNL